ncbi:MAG: ABC transporter permease subunit, partial [Ilumatobacteraceae bacterium]
MRALGSVWRSWSGRIGLLLASLIITCAVVSLFWTPHDPSRLVPTERWQGISASHWFGTDGGGRDLFSQVLAGARLTLLVAVGSATVAAVVGVVLGGLSAMTPVWVGEPMVQVIDVLIALPTLVLAIVLVAIFGGSALTAIVAIGIGSGVVIARTVRAEMSSVRQRDFVVAATASGSSTMRTVIRH